MPGILFRVRLQGAAAGGPASSSVRLVKSADAAKMLAIGERKLWSLTASGLIQSIRIGRSVRYDVRDIEAFIEKLKSEC